MLPNPHHSSRCALRCQAIAACFFFAFFDPIQVFAATAEEQNLFQQDIQAKQRIESERQNLIRQKEAEEINNIGKAKAVEVKNLNLEEDILDKTCRVIKEFRISGNSEVYTWTLNRKFITPLQKKNSCFTKADLAKFHDQISNYYLQQGYVLARVYFDVTKISENVIGIVIEEGRLEKLELKDNSKLNEVLPFRRDLQKFFAFPSLAFDPDYIVKLRDIEQGLDQINRLSSQSAKMAIEAGSKAGYSNVGIENQISHLATVTLGADNSGNQSTGKQKRKTSLNYDNFFGINDNTYLNYSESNAVPLFGSKENFNKLIGTSDNSKSRFSKAFYGSFSVPLGYWTLGASYSYSKYLLTTAGTAATFKSSGNSESKTYYLERVLSRGQKYKISFKGELTKSDTDSYLEDTYIPVNSRNLTEANFYLNNTFYLANGSLFLQPKYSKGLTAFGALKDSPNLAKDKPHAQAKTFGLYAQSNLNFVVPKVAIPLNHKLTFDGTKSNSSLYGSDQFSLGGRYTVRGFQESIISGDSGYLIKNDLSARLSDLIPKELLGSKALTLGDNFSVSAILNKFRLGIFHDYGYVRNRVINSPNDEGYMSGAGTVLNYAGKFLSWDLTYSKGLHSPQFLRNLDHLSKDNETIYFSLSFALGIL